METGSLNVQEVTASDSIGDLMMRNMGHNLVLALDGEELLGAEQNRILNTSILLEKNKQTMVPASCTEQRRWAYTSIEFEPSVSFAPPRIRQRNLHTVTQSLRHRRGFRTDQEEVWDGVACLAAETGVHSPTRRNERHSGVKA